MATFLKTTIKRSLAENMLRDLINAENQYFFFVAKTTEWANPNAPDAFIDSDRSDVDVSRSIIGYKKINPSNVSFAIPRYDWSYGTEYDQYDDKVNLFDADDPKIFYVLTNQNHIYKCIYNNNESSSTVQPSLVISASFETADGYIWKYLGSIEEENLPVNLTDYIPVNYITSTTNITTQNQYNNQLQAKNGAITRVDISGSADGRYTHTVTDTPSKRGLLVSKFTAFAGTESQIEIIDPDSVSILSTIETQYGGSAPFNSGYVFRIKQNASAIGEINNYGIIIASGVTAGTSGRYFTIRDDVIDFKVTVPSSGTAPIAEILPLIKVHGDGTDAVLFPKMAGSPGFYYIDSVEVINAGLNYSSTNIEVISPPTSGTVSPIMTSVLSPKGGHGSNILKELNADSVLIVVTLTEDDEEKIRAGGSYRQFGIIKNPTLMAEKGTLAGMDDRPFRDITLLYEGSSNTTTVANSVFGSTADVMVVGLESFSASKVYALKSSNPTTKRVVVQTGSVSDPYVTYQQRSQDYLLRLNNTGAIFTTGEKIVQYIPVGITFTVAGSLSVTGVSFAYGIQAEGVVLGISEITPGGYTVGVRSTRNSFAVTNNAGLTGDISGATGTIVSVTPRYGEYVLTAQLSSGLSFTSNRAFKILETDIPYFDSSSTSRYSGLHSLKLNTSVSGATGALDTTVNALTPTSFLPGDIVTQGNTGSYNVSYARGVVYNWEFVNNAYGILLVSNVDGKFKNVSENGITGSNIGNFIVSGVSLPDIDPLSGEILYIDNVRAIDRVVGQDEEFRLSVGF